MKDLQQQIAELTAKHNLQSLVENKLPNIKVYTNDFNYKALGVKYTFTAKLEDCPLHEIQPKIAEVIAAFPPTRNNLLTFAGKDNQETASPYVLKFGNNINNNEVKIEYVSGDFWAHIALPLSYYSNDVKGVFMRKVYDTEHHYFGGVSMKKINRMQIRSYKLDMFESVRYYGGDVTNYITNVEDKGEFECVVLNGHIPQFKDFWQSQLIKP